MRVDEPKNPREVLRSNDGGKPEFAPEFRCSSSGLRGLAVCVTSPSSSCHPLDREGGDDSMSVAKLPIVELVDFWIINR